MPFLAYATIFAALLRLSTAIVPLGPSYKFLSELSPEARPDISELNGLVPSDVFLRTDTLVLTPGDGLSLSCDSHGAYKLYLDPQGSRAINFANYIQHGPILVSNAFNTTCKVFSDTTVLGATKQLPKEWQDLAASNPDLHYTILEPLYVTLVAPCRIEFVAAVGDYHSLFGTIEKMDSPELAWLEANVEPWDVQYTGTVSRTVKRFLLTTLVVSSAIGHFVGAAVLGGAATGVYLATQN